jgi:hypothetical protein
MKRQGASLPWSGTRDAMVKSVSTSAGEGAGPESSTGLNERRVVRSFNASAIVNLSAAGGREIGAVGAKGKPLQVSLQQF